MIYRAEEFIYKDENFIPLRAFYYKATKRNKVIDVIIHKCLLSTDYNDLTEYTDNQYYCIDYLTNNNNHLWRIERLTKSDINEYIDDNTEIINIA